MKEAHISRLEDGVRAYVKSPENMENFHPRNDPANMWYLFDQKIMSLTTLDWPKSSITLENGLTLFTTRGLTRRRDDTSLFDLVYAEDGNIVLSIELAKKKQDALELTDMATEASEKLQ